MWQALLALGRSLLDSLRDLAPIIIVIAFFQLAVLQQPIPDLAGLLGGTLLVALGLTFFIYGLDMGLFPIGESMAQAFAQKGSVFWFNRINRPTGDLRTKGPAEVTARELITDIPL